MDRRKSFVLYTDYRKHLGLLTDQEKGKLFMALFDYAENRELPQLSAKTSAAFSSIKERIDRNLKGGEGKCQGAE